MSKILILSVGGSPEPLIKSILHHKPEAVYFIASHQTVDMIGEIKATLKSASESRRFEQKTILLKDPQKLEECFKDMKQVIIEIKQMKLPPEKVIVDYTGGTKAMSAALVLLTVPEGYRFSYVGGKKRTKDGVGIVEPGFEEIWETESPWETYAYKELEKICLYFNQYQFITTLDILKEAKKKINKDSKRSYLFKGLEKLIEGYRNWDNFNHDKALVSLKESIDIFKPYSSFSEDERIKGLVTDITRQLSFLGKIGKSCMEGNLEVIELVWDLIANAERRIKEGKFDDATARMYRATELGAQITLMEKGLDTGNLDIKKLPEELKDKYEQRRGEDGKVKIGLMSDFELLKELGHPLGDKYIEIKNYLPLRNNSILAHGACPVTEKGCKSFLEKIKLVYNIKEEYLPKFPPVNIELFS